MSAVGPRERSFLDRDVSRYPGPLPRGTSCGHYRRSMMIVPASVPNSAPRQCRFHNKPPRDRSPDGTTRFKIEGLANTRIPALPGWLYRLVDPATGSSIVTPVVYPGNSLPVNRSELTTLEPGPRIGMSEPDRIAIGVSLVPSVAWKALLWHTGSMPHALRSRSPGSIRVRMTQCTHQLPARGVEDEFIDFPTC